MHTSPISAPRRRYFIMDGSASTQAARRAASKRATAWGLTRDEEPDGGFLPTQEAEGVAPDPIRGAGPPEAFWPIIAYQLASDDRDIIIREVPDAAGQTREAKRYPRERFSGEVIGENIVIAKRGTTANDQAAMTRMKAERAATTAKLEAIQARNVAFRTRETDR